MTDKEILEQAILKAQKNRYVGGSNITGFLICSSNKHSFRKYIEDKEYYPIIFSHKFAKTFWGEKEHQHNPNFSSVFDINLKEYEYHLRIMVLEKEPLKYLEKFL